MGTVKYLAAVTHKQFNSKGGYGYLCAKIIDDAVSSWEKENSDIFAWIDSDCSNLWFDYLGLNKEYFKRLLKRVELT